MRVNPIYVAVLVAFAFGVARGETYFDAHNHFTGILPYYAYANLPAFISRTTESINGVAFDDRLALFRYLSDNWYAQHRDELGNRLFSPSDGQRFSLGARGFMPATTMRLKGTCAAPRSWIWRQPTFTCRSNRYRLLAAGRSTVESRRDSIRSNV
jgi:hypothetical protein